MNRAAWRATLSLTLVLTAVACTDNVPPPPRAARSTAAPVVIAEKPLWHGTTGRPQTSPRAEIRGDSVLFFGNIASELDRQLLVADAETGEPRWQVDQLKNLPRRSDRQLGFTPQHISIEGTPDEWSAFIPYLTNDDMVGVAKLSGDDGRVLWESPVRVTPSLSPIRHEVVATNERFVVSGVRALDDQRRTQVIATDAVTGRRLWESAGIWPQFVVGNTLLAQAGAQLGDAPEHSIPIPQATVVGLDATTGKRQWDLSSRYPSLKVFAVLGGVAVAGRRSASQPDRMSIVVLDVATGDTVAELGDATNCVHDEQRLVICSTGKKSTFVVFDVRTREANRITLPATVVFDAWHGYLMVGDHRVFDSSGTLVTDTLPGSVIAMSEDYVVLYDPQSNDYTVHRRVTEPTAPSRTPR